MEKSISTRLGAKTWLSILIFGLVGQIAWVVENMYFSKFMQDNVERAAYATTLMVALSAITATVVTVVTGGLVDRVGKRKIFVCTGYILWGFATMAFALIPVDRLTPENKPAIVAAVVVMDCLMTLFGSLSNDAAFNTWVTDVTDTTNRGRVETTLAIMPVAATILVFVGLDSLTSGGRWNLFFTILGVIPIAGGLLGFALMKDAPGIIRNRSKSYWNDVFYSFRPDVIKGNRTLYVALLGGMFSGISMQVYSSYLINFVEDTLGVVNYILPLGIIILAAAGTAVVSGILVDKIGRDKLYYPAILMNAAGGVLVFATKFFSGEPSRILLLLIAGGVLIMAAALAMTTLFLSCFRDYIPAGREGAFQSARMALYVLVPMIIGPIIANLIISGVNLRSPEGELQYPPELFLAAAVLVLFALFPAREVRRHDKIDRAEKLKAIEEKRTQSK